MRSPAFVQVLFLNWAIVDKYTPPPLYPPIMKTESTDDVVAYQPILKQITTVKKERQRELDQTLNTLYVLVSKWKWIISGLQPLIWTLVKYFGLQIIWTSSSCRERCSLIRSKVVSNVMLVIGFRFTCKFLTIKPQHSSDFFRIQVKWHHSAVISTYVRQDFIPISSKHNQAYSISFLKVLHAPYRKSNSKSPKRLKLQSIILLIWEI